MDCVPSNPLSLANTSVLLSAVTQVSPWVIVSRSAEPPEQPQIQAGVPWTASSLSGFQAAAQNQGSRNATGSVLTSDSEQKSTCSFLTASKCLIASTT